MEKATAETIPLSLPEIKELRMEPGRKGACMHINKSTSNAHTHTHTCTRVRPSHQGARWAQAGEDPNHSPPLVWHKKLNWEQLTHSSVVSEITSAVICCDTTSRFGWMRWDQGSVTLHTKKRRHPQWSSRSLICVICWFLSCDCVTCSDSLESVSRRGAGSEGNCTVQPATKTHLKHFRLHKNETETWEEQEIAEDRERQQREEVVLCSCLWVPRTCAHKVIYHWQVNDRQFCSSLWWKRRDSS